MFLLPYLGFIFAAASLPIGAQVISKHRRLLLPVSFACAIVYGWLSAIEKLTPFSFPVIMLVAVQAFFVYTVFIFLLDKYDETLAPWFSVYVVALLFFLFFL